ncbi:MAG TPA: toll/interleukin-1 receptor domain-containing protein [Isosphaeraceae bacterium]|jgi:hypothetical protein|nr:toll/interleukin-1 receptor domain-containing protein [Isosphaeraceae bacterium]
MSVSTKVHDIFLSASTRDRAVASVVRTAFEEEGLATFSDAEVGRPGARWEEVAREAISESLAFVALLTPASVRSPWLALEYGLARGWNKSIYLLTSEVEAGEVPPFLREYVAHPVARVAEVVEAVKRDARPLSDREAGLLIDSYKDVGVSADRLAVRPASLDALARRFNEQAGSNRPAEQLLQELFRLRKRRKLPGLPKSGKGRERRS